MSSEHFDVLVVGAGLSGIGAGFHLQTECPTRSYAILESRGDIGGTWDLFRYPGVRSDSDMYTLGYAFHPWKDPKAIADGASILAYIRETAAAFGIDRKIRFQHRVVEASWSTPDARWTVVVERGPSRERVTLTCNFLFSCAGYYRYDAGHTPTFPGIDRFRGRVVHPQQWTPDVAYAGKRVVVIGSGATAVTLVPELAKTAAHVTMLQRSPTYIVSHPDEDAFANWARERFSERIAYAAARWKNVLLGLFFFQLSRRRPEYVKGRILEGIRNELGADYDVSHFTPSYNPWDQRVCLVPNGDLFAALRERRASMVTDRIDTFTEGAIELASGAKLDADLVVTATGLELEVFGGISVSVDGRHVDFSRTLAYKGMMFSDVPNFASCFGYTNASWTLKCDLTCAYVCRLLNRMERRGYRACTPHVGQDTPTRTPFLDFTSGYVKRSIAKFPSQGSRAPWRLYQNYALDMLSLRFGRLDDGAMHFAR